MSSPLPIPAPKAAQQTRPLGYSPSPFQPRANRKMSLAQTYFLAHKARAKLSSEAARPDHNLRLLVGHANLLDSLMLELADAEREQESWFNQTVRGASHSQWADTIVEEPEPDWRAEDAESDSSDDSDSDSDSDIDLDEDIDMADTVALTRIPSHQSMLPHKAGAPYHYDDEDDYDMEDDEADFEHLALQRSPSHSTSLASPPPKLDDDSEGDSTEDESMPPSPPTTLIAEFEEQKGVATSTTTAAPSSPGQVMADKTAFYEEGYYLPPRNPARLVSTITVY